MTRISLNVVVYNEESRLEECLSDARDHVDEIVVVDQMSTDATPEIAQRLADVYVRDVHHGHAEPSRELAASRSSGEWILILDADERMSELLKAELPSLIAGEPDGYWIQKANFVGGAETSKVQHFRLFRKSRARFDPGPHGGATAVSDNVERFDRVGIIHEKSVEEQIYDDARYERIALEDSGPTSSKRNWLQHNRTLRAEREQRRRTDLEALVPEGAHHVLVVGDVRVELDGRAAVRIDPAAANGDSHAASAGPADEAAFDAAVVALAGDDPLTGLPAVARLVRPGGVIVGTVPAARNRRRLEDVVAAVMSEGGRLDVRPAAGSTRAALLEQLGAAGLDARWTALVRDGWLDPVALRPDGTGAVVESEDFLLKRVPAEVAEELTAEEIVFAAVRQDASTRPECSIVLAALPGADPQKFADALRDTGPQQPYELVVVHSLAKSSPVAGATSVVVAEEAGRTARWNAGARAASGAVLAFVSTDSTPLPGWLDAAVDAHRARPDVGAVGSMVLGPDGSIEHAGLVLGPDHVPYRIYQGASAATPCVNRPRVMPAVVAEGMVTARARFVEVGGFDETLGEDLADADFCMRLRSRGRPVVYASDAAICSEQRAVPGSRDDFRRTAREFAARWSRTACESDEVICSSDGYDLIWQRNRSWRLPRPTSLQTAGLPAVAWTSHFFEQGGYTEEALAAVEALDDAGLYVVASPVRWDRPGGPLPARKAERLATLIERDLPDDFVHVAHIGADRFKRHPGAMRNVGRTMFETTGLPADWVMQCNLMDEVWVPCEHNLRSFAAAGVEASKLHKVPETYDTELFDPGVPPLAIENLKGFVFLSVFAWLDRKAWDLLLRAWYEEFGKQDDVTLLLKADTSLAPPGTDCRTEVDSYVRRELGRDPTKGARVEVLDRQLEVTDVPPLYRAADAFVVASRGEGWGRPHMEAMAMGLPTIATRWSGNLDFMNDDNSYLVDYKLVDAPADAWHRGQQWAQPSVRHLRRVMRRVYEHRAEADAVGARARADVLVSCRPELVVAAVRDRIEAADRHPVHVAVAKQRKASRSNLRSPGSRPRKGRRQRLTACVVVQHNEPFLPQCLSSLRDVADAVVVVHAEADDDMASVRNDAVDQAKGKWVLMLDATHTLDPESGDLVRHLVGQEQFVGFAAHEVRQFGFDGAVSAIEEWRPVLFPRDPGLRYVGRVAEQLLPTRPGLEFRLARSPLVLHQHDPRPERYDRVAEARRNLPILERCVKDAPDEPFHLYNFGAALGHLGLHDEAEAALRQATRRASRGAIWAAPALVARARAVSAQGRKAEAVKLSKAATKSAPDWAQGWCLLGEALVDAGRPEPALVAYERALLCATDSWLAVGDRDDTMWQVRAGVGKIHLQRGEFAEAADALGGAVARNPSDPELRVLLARAAEELGRSSAARQHLSRATAAARAGSQAYVAFGNYFTKMAEDALLRGLADNPESRVLLERIERLRAARLA